MLEPVFNDLSVNPLAADQAGAFQRMSNLVELLRVAPDYGIGSGFRIPLRFYNFQLCPEYNIYDWLHDTRVPKELTLFMLTLTTQSPYLDQTPDAVREREKLVEVRREGIESDSLRAAYLLETLLISFCEAQWNTPYIECECIEFFENEELQSDAISLRNLSELSHFTVHSDWIKERRKKNIVSPQDLWESRETYFPNLDFCPSTEDELTQLGTNNPRFKQVVKKLYDMEDYFSTWAEGAFDPNAFTKCNPVSNETLTQYRESYTYINDIGENVLARWHLYLTPGKGRLYFEADGTNRRGIVCYVGDKLPDVTYGSH